MRKLHGFAALLLLLLVGVAAAAQRPCGNGVSGFENLPLHLPETVAAGSCDTVAFGFPIPAPLTLYTSQNWGFASGHNGYGDLSFAERVENINGFAQVFGIKFTFGQASSSGPSAHVIARVWPEVSGVPGTPLYSQNILVDDIITANGHITLHFPSPVAVSGPFYVGFSAVYAIGDTVAVLTTRDSTVSPSTAWSQFSNGDWFRFDDGTNSWGLDVAQAIYPLVLDGNFPVTVLPANPTIASGGQIQLQAAGGFSYEWIPATGLSCSTCPNPLASPTVTTTYHVLAWDTTHSCTVVTEQTITVTMVGVEDGLFGGQVKVYPNPSSGRVMLDFHQPEPADLEVSLVNSMGQAVYLEALAGFVGDYHGSVDLSGFAKGVYLLKVSDGDRRFVARLRLD